MGGGWVEGGSGGGGQIGEMSVVSHGHSWTQFRVRRRQTSGGTEGEGRSIFGFRGLRVFRDVRIGVEGRGEERRERGGTSETRSVYQEERQGGCVVCAGRRTRNVLEAPFIKRCVEQGRGGSPPRDESQ